jgi:pimeloyl-ACP methyl ester carboxylesterase
LRTESEYKGWPIRQSGSSAAEHTVLLLPGGLCTAVFFDDLLEQPSLEAASLRLIATTLPGFGGTPPPDDLSMESYARQATALARELGCDAVLGHSLGANVAIEMAAGAGFSGPMLLLSPSFSRRDESRVPRALDWAAGMLGGLGDLPYAAVLSLLGVAMRRSLPPYRRRLLVAEMRKTDPRFLKDQTRGYLAYLDRHGSLVGRLCDANVQATVAFGERDDVRLAPGERRGLERCPWVRLATVEGAGHFTLNQRPARVADLLVELLWRRR